MSFSTKDQEVWDKVIAQVPRKHGRAVPDFTTNIGNLYRLIDALKDRYRTSSYLHFNADGTVGIKLERSATDPRFGTPVCQTYSDRVPRSDFMSRYCELAVQVAEDHKKVLLPKKVRSPK